jgi:hypothetical protein
MRLGVDQHIIEAQAPRSLSFRLLTLVVDKLRRRSFLFCEFQWATGSAGEFDACLSRAAAKGGIRCAAQVEVNDRRSVW